MNQSVDSVCTISERTSVVVVSVDTLVSSLWWVQMESPESTVDVGKVWSDGEDFVDDIFNADTSVMSETSLNQLVVSDGNTLLVDLEGSTLVDEFADGLEVWCSVGDVWFDQLEHGQSSLGELEEDSVVDLTKTQQL